MRSDQSLYLRLLLLLAIAALGLTGCGQSAEPPDPNQTPNEVNFEVTTGPEEDAGEANDPERDPTQRDSDGGISSEIMDTADTSMPSSDADEEEHAETQDAPSPSDEDAALDATTDALETEDIGVATSCEGLDNGAPCEDGDLCTQGDTCLIGVCQAGETLVCNGQGPCRIGSCDPSDGGCDYANAEEGAACDDEDACTASSSCQEGICVAGAALECEDMGPCQNVTCESLEEIGRAHV